ncbi:caspase domain-containing protein [Plantactinospora solaniradicis]|uniref:Caspase domain-containing protein n=1 Tax=Plantactinospora solaniradicis TaxID=1723736 RepID=A0ABW1KL73_9ACTN
MLTVDPARYAREVIIPLRGSQGPFPDDLLRQYAIDPAMTPADLHTHLAWLRDFWKRAVTRQGPNAPVYRRLLALDAELQRTAGTAMHDPVWWRDESARQDRLRLDVVRALTQDLRKAFGTQVLSRAQEKDLRRHYAQLPTRILDDAAVEAGLRWTGAANVAEPTSVAAAVAEASLAAGDATAAGPREAPPQPSQRPSVPAADRPPRAGRLPVMAESSVVLLGAAQFEDDNYPPLPSVRNNLTDLASRLADPEHGGFDPARVHTFHDPGPAIAGALAQIAEETTDTLVFYYAGHGVVPSDGNLHLVLHNTRSRHEIFTSLPYDQVRRAMLNSPAVNRLVILDCCFSGRAIEWMAGGGLVSGQLDVAGAYTLTATSATRPAHAAEGSRNSSFTAALLQVLAEGTPDSDRLIQVNELYPHLLRRLRSHGMPAPSHQGTNSIGNLALVRNPMWGSDGRIAETAI